MYLSDEHARPPVGQRRSITRRVRRIRFLKFSLLVYVIRRYHHRRCCRYRLPRIPKRRRVADLESLRRAYGAVVVVAQPTVSSGLVT